MTIPQRSKRTREGFPAKAFVSVLSQFRAAPSAFRVRRELTRERLRNFFRYRFRGWLCKLYESKTQSPHPKHPKNLPTIDNALR